MTQRYRFLRAEEHGGRRVAVIRDSQPAALEGGEELRVYYNRGRWRRWEARRGDELVGDKLAAVARRGLANQERIGEEAQPLEELEPEPAPEQQAERVRLFEAPQTTPGQLTMGGGEADNP